MMFLRLRFWDDVDLGVLSLSEIYWSLVLKWLRLSASSYIGAAESKVDWFDDNCEMRELMEAGRCLSTEGDGWSGCCCTVGRRLVFCKVGGHRSSG